MSRPARRSARILVVDDDPGLLRLLTIRLRAEKYEVEPADSAAKALTVITRFRPDLVITDLRMAEMDGIALLKELQRRWPSLNVIMLTAHGTIPDAVKATQAGAFAFLTKPVEKTQLLEEVRRALKTSGFSDTEADDWRAEFATRSPIMEDVLAKAHMAAETDTPIVITGEPGTGKEPLARAIHRASARRDGPFVAVDCGALEGDAGSNELAAVLQRAMTGTVLLVNVDDLAPMLQARLAEQTARGTPPTPEATGAPVAASATAPVAPSASAPVATSAPSPILSPTPTPSQPRLIATTNRPLEDLATESRFSTELLERLSGVSIELPALDKRREDLPLLVAQCLDDVARETTQPRKACSPEALELLAGGRWPGNVRQLRRVLRQVATVTASPVITADQVRDGLGKTTQLPSFEEARDEFTRNYLVQLLQITEGNVSQSARLAKRNRTDFYKLLSKHGLDPDEFK
jgi:two-component system response regulator GlrR